MSNNLVTGDQLLEIITAINTKYNERFARKEDIAASYKDKGSKAAAELTSALLVEANEGYGYNLADELVITKDNKDLFVESAALRAAEYVATADTTAKDGKTYYTQGGTAPDYTYTAASGLTPGADISAAGYYEYVEHDKYAVGTNVMVVEATPAEYALTGDTVAVAGKTYYKSNGLLPPTYKAVAKVVVGTTDVSAYYEKTAAATYKFDAMPGIFTCKVVTEEEVQDIIDSIDE